MAVITIKKNQDFTDYSVGWKELTIISAEKGKYDNEKATKYIDLRFESYPENMKLRLHQKFNKTTKEEFCVTRAFRYTNTGIKEIAESEGDYRVEIDTNPEHLIGQKINGYFYKNEKGYTDISDNILPAKSFENQIEKWDEKKIEESKSYTFKNNIKPYIPNQNEIVGPVTRGNKDVDPENTDYGEGW